MITTYSRVEFLHNDLNVHPSFFITLSKSNLLRLFNKKNNPHPRRGMDTSACIIFVLTGISFYITVLHVKILQHETTTVHLWPCLRDYLT